VSALTLCVAVIAAAWGLAAGAWGIASAGSTVALRSDAAANQSAAQSAAASLLASLTLPAGAIRSPTEPAGDGSVLAQPSSGPVASPNVVVEGAWWVVPGTPAQVLAYITAHPPAGSTRFIHGAGASGANGASSMFAGFSLPPIVNVLSTRSLVVDVVQLPSGSTGLRADAQVLWVTPRPATERIPPGIHRVRVSVRSTIPRNKPHQPSFTVSAPKRVHRLVALLNKLPAGQPGTYACPVDSGIRVRLAFYASHAVAPLAVVLVNPGGCEDVQLTLDGLAQPALTSQWFPGSDRSPKTSLIAQLDAALGVKLKTS